MAGLTLEGNAPRGERPGRFMADFETGAAEERAGAEGRAPATPFAAWLAEAMRARQVTAKQLAAQSGLSQSMISMLMSGARRPSRSVVNKVAPALAGEDGDAHGVLSAALRAAGFDPPPPPSLKDTVALPEYVADLPEDLQEALRYIMGLRPEVRDYMLKLWTEQARPHLEMQAELERRRAQIRREIDEIERDSTR